MIRYYFLEALEPTLLYGFVTGLLGLVVSLHYGGVHVFLGFLAIMGSVIVQASVNILDDYFDFEIGIDRETVKTKFSGGSKFIVNNSISPKAVLSMGLALVAIAFLIGAYLLSKTIIILPLIVFGGLSTLLYAKYLVRLPFMAEVITFLNFTFIAIGTFIITLNGIGFLIPALFSFIPIGMSVGVAVIVNSVPDQVIDKKFGRKSGIVLFKNNKTRSKYYLLWQIAIIAILSSGIVLNMLPYLFILVILAFIISSVHTYHGIRSYKTPIQYEKYMGFSNIAILAASILMVISYVV